MAARAGKILVPANSIWWTKTETWPVIACIGAAVGWTCYMSTRECAGRRRLPP